MPAATGIDYVLDKLRWMQAEHIWPNGLRYVWTDAFGVVLLVSLYRTLAKDAGSTDRGLPLPIRGSDENRNDGAFRASALENGKIELLGVGPHPGFTSSLKAARIATLLELCHDMIGNGRAFVLAECERRHRVGCRNAAIWLLLRDNRTLLTHRRSVACDPSRHGGCGRECTFRCVRSIQNLPIRISCDKDDIASLSAAESA